MRTSPVQFVVRSSVASWIATGTPSSVSLASTSRTKPLRGSVLVGGEALLGVPRLAVLDGAAAVGVDLGGGLAAAGRRRRNEGTAIGHEHEPARVRHRRARYLRRRWTLARPSLAALHGDGAATPAGEELQVIVRGDGCYLEDVAGRRYLDALAGLFCVNIGYGFGEEMGEAAAAQMRELPFAINWTFAHPRSIELAAEIAALAPGDLNRVFFVSGGSEAVEAAWKLARQYHTARGRAALEGDRPAGGVPRHHDGRALDQRLHRAARAVRAARPGRAARVEHEPLPPPAGRDARSSFTELLLDELEATIVQAGPEHRRDGDHRAGAELRAARSCRRPATSRACASCATGTASCSASTR